MPSRVEQEFEQQMKSRYQAWKEFGYVANRFLMAVRKRGGVGAAKYLLAKKGISPGLARLATHITSQRNIPTKLIAGSMPYRSPG